MNKNLHKIYLHLGGEEKLRIILYDFYRRMAQDTMLGYFFDGKDPKNIAEKQLHFLLYLMGVLPSYQGKSPTASHIALPPIHSGHFDRRLVLLRQTLEAHRLTSEDIQNWLDFENTFRSVIVT